MKKTVAVVLITAVAIIISGCAKPPKMEIDTAKQAVSDAKKVEADRYAPKKLKQSEETLASALGEIENQKKKLLGKDYTKAIGLLKEVVALSQDAIKETEELKEKTVEEATKADAETQVNSVYAAYKKAKKSKKSKALLSQVMDLLKKAQSAMKEGRYQDAVDFAKQAETRLATL